MPKAGGAAAAMSAIRSSSITPGPLGIAETSPMASAPAATAASASASLEMQQILTRVRTRAELPPTSWPGSSRPSTYFYCSRAKNVDARNESDGVDAPSRRHRNVPRW